MPEVNPNSRLEAFCDGVFAIALTLLIIDIKTPSYIEINDTGEFWIALKHIAPSVFTFILSFVIILITWVNHHGALKQVNRSSPSFIYSNGFLVLTVVFLPFPTSLLGEHLLTDHAVPAVVLFNSTLALQAFGWVLLTGAALKNKLAKDEKGILILRGYNRYGYFAVILYSVCTIVAFWFPFGIALFTTATWIFWLIFGISVKNE